MALSAAFGGAGTYGALEVGAYLALVDHVLTPYPELAIDEVAGTSAGAIVAAMIALQTPVAVLENIALEADYEELIDESVLHLELSLFSQNEISYSSNKNVMAWLTEMTAGKLLKDCPIHLKTVTADVVEGGVHVWDSAIDTEMKIADAIYSSMAVPLMFPPYKGRYVDGGASRNIPVQYLTGQNRIGFAIASANEKGPITGNFNFISRLVSMLLTDEDQLIEMWATATKTPIIQLPGNHYGFLDRHMTYSEKSGLLNVGHETAAAFFKSTKGKRWIANCLKNLSTNIPSSTNS